MNTVLRKQMSSSFKPTKDYPSFRTYKGFTPDPASLSGITLARHEVTHSQGWWHPWSLPETIYGFIMKGVSPLVVMSSYFSG